MLLVALLILTAALILEKAFALILLLGIALFVLLVLIIPVFVVLVVNVKLGVVVMVKFVLVVVVVVLVLRVVLKCLSPSTGAFSIKKEVNVRLKKLRICNSTCWILTAGNEKLVLAD